MHGVNYIVDDTGRRKAVMVDLADWGKLWEDFQDVIVSESRKHEPTVTQASCLRWFLTVVFPLAKTTARMVYELW